MIFTNATLHWVTDSTKCYSLIYKAIKNGGRLAVCQGGYGCYKGLHEALYKVIKNLNYDIYYNNWIYPIFYPAKQEMEQLLFNIGFKKIKVESAETDGIEYTDLYNDFSNAGMLTYLKKLPDEKLQKKLKKSFLDICISELISILIGCISML